MNITLSAVTDGQPFSPAKECADLEFTIAGRGVHNPNFPHQLVSWIGTDRPCCHYPAEHMHLQARPIVISLARHKANPRCLTVHIGDVLTIDGEPWMVTSRPVADPVLTRPQN